MKTKSAWIKFLEDIEQAKSDLRFEKNQECFYRGHSNSKYELLPGLFREIGVTSKKVINDIWDAEYSMFYEFRSRAQEVHNGNLSDWDILFYMQHHGCKTRLLDWTENFGVALYFALLKTNDNRTNSTIWILNPYALNRAYQNDNDLYSPENLNYNDISYSDTLLDDYKFWWNKPIALYPIRRIDRLINQGGYFTIHGKDKRPIEKQIPYSKNIWRKIELSANAIEDGKKFLEMAGINAFTMFPDLDGLAKYLNHKYF